MYRILCMMLLCTVAKSVLFLPKLDQSAFRDIMASSRPLQFCLGENFAQRLTQFQANIAEVSIATPGSDVVLGLLQTAAELRHEAFGAFVALNSSPEKTDVAARNMLEEWLKITAVLKAASDISKRFLVGSADIVTPGACAVNMPF